MGVCRGCLHGIFSVTNCVQQCGIVREGKGVRVVVGVMREGQSALLGSCRVRRGGESSFPARIDSVSTRHPSSFTAMWTRFMTIVHELSFRRLRRVRVI